MKSFTAVVSVANMKLTLLVCLILGVSLTLSHPVDQDYEQQWQEFKMTHNRKFQSKREELMRKNIFVKNARMIHQHNKEHERGLKSFAMTLNKFSDWTPEELFSFSGKEMKTQYEKKNALSYLSPLNLGELPEEVDWRKHNMVTPVRNQGACGSCYAFSSLGALEGQVARKTGEKPVWLSPQNIVDCAGNTTIYNNNGCHGGNMIKVFNYILDYGVDTEKSYPYEFLNESRECRYNKDSVGAEITDYVMLDQYDEDQLLEAVATIGPISVAIDSSSKSFHHYSHGVYDNLDFTKDKGTHAVLVVGYGKENGKKYWLIKNSWGERWGEHGYIKILRGVNLLNVAMFSVFPVL